MKFKIGKIWKTVLYFGVVALMFFVPASPSITAGGSTVPDSTAGAPGPAEIKSKDEVIYAVLSSDGSVRELYAVNHFAVAKAGSITDYGDYMAVINLTDTTPMAQNGDAVTVQTNAGNFYYQGNMAATDLPWIFDISYALDGADATLQELAGKSGELTIHILTKQNTAVNPTFYNNYMLQISITLDTEKCSDIKAPGAAVARAGKNKVIAYTVLPGQDADISLSATVRDFAMAGIDISAMPFSLNVELPDMDSMTGDFDRLAAALSVLNDGVGKLADGVSEFKSGADKLKIGSADIKNGLSELRNNSGQLIQASSQISGALAQIASSLNGASGEMGLADLAQLPQGLNQLAGGLAGIAGGLSELKSGFSLAHAALNGAIQGIPEATVSEEQITTLYTQTDPSQHGLLDQLIASYTAGQTVKGTYNQVKGAFDAVVPTINTLSASINTISAALAEMSGKISSALPETDMMQQLAQLSAALSELDRNYTVFHNGLMEYMNSIGELSAGYDEFDNGLSSFGNGVGELYDGVVELHGGTTRLSDETAEIPGTIQSKIDALLAGYTRSDFKPVSFTSPKNEHTNLVQFVLRCDGFEKTEEKKSLEVEAGTETFLDRLIALFTGK